MSSAARQEYMRKWRSENAARVREHRKRYIASDPDRVRELQNIYSNNWRAANPDKRRESFRACATKRRIAGKTQEYLRTPRGRYNQQKAHAKQRGIEFLLSFDEWIGIWISSGHFEDRGRGAGAYNMCRIGDKGPYAVGNVFIGTVEQNSSEGNLGRQKSKKDRT